MSFTGKEEHDVPIATAAEWTKNYRDASTPGATIAHFFGKDIVQRILNQDKCVGIRLYYAIDDDGKKQLIMVGANGDENDLCDGIIADRSLMCPTHCSTANPLNSNPTT